VSEIDPESGKMKVIEKSWFDRGTKLLITGIRRGDTFFPKRYFDSVYQHTVCKIENVSEDGKYMELKYDRERSE
jgi:DNA polymerase-3 subunit alpha